MSEKSKTPGGVERWIYGVMSCFYDDAPLTSRGGGSTLATLAPSGLVCPGFGVATAIAAAFPIR